MAKKVVRVALWEYLNKQKKRRMAYYGDEIDLSAAEVKRGEAAGVFNELKVDAAVDTAPAATEAEAPLTTPAAVVLGAAADGDGDADDLAGLAGDDAAGGDDSGSETAAPVAKPLNTALDEEWVAYAVSKGFDQEEAEKMVAADRAGLIKALA